MKRFQSAVALLFVSLMMMACVPSTRSGSGGAIATPQPGTTTIRLQPNKLYEFGAIWTQPGKEKQLRRYFKQATPLVMKHGFRILSRLPVHKALQGGFRPDQLMFAEWPNAKALKAAFADPKLKPLLASRKASVKKLAFVQTKVRKPQTLSLRNGEVVDVTMIWLKKDPAKLRQFQSYLKQMFPIAKQYGYRALASFKPVHAQGLSTPDMLIIGKWKRQDGLQRILKDPRIKKLLPIRNNAMNRIIVNHHRVQLPFFPKQ